MTVPARTFESGGLEEAVRTVNRDIYPEDKVYVIHGCSCRRGSDADKMTVSIWAMGLPALLSDKFRQSHAVDGF